MVKIFKKNQFVVLVGALCAVAGFLGGYFVHSDKPLPLQRQVVPGKEIRQGGYKYINPLLEFEFGPEFQELTPFKYKVEQKVTELEQDTGAISTVAVYFRDLNNGPWYGVNESQNYSPASLLKVPLMIAYFKQAEANPAVLNTKLTYSKLVDVGSEYQYFRPSQTIELGKSYTVNELIERMIVYSDNQALALLSSYNESAWLKTYTDLGINIPPMRGLDDYMSVKDYASFFRILYNASYLNKEHSSLALELLSKSEFNWGLRAGVPPEIGVAHKFGERHINDMQQLHDCGIVYYPNHPYLLCIMTRGRNLSALAKAIQEISGLIYNEIQSQNK
jgi:beta-lactamase class A